MSKKNKAKSPCEKYELAITNYVIGEKIDIPQSELFEHLARCQSCQGDLRNWQATYGMMRAREYDSRPEVKQKSQTFIKELVYQGKQIEKTQLDFKWGAGLAAGEVYRLLKANGELSIPAICQRTGLKEYNVQQAIGWLAKEEKIQGNKDHKTAYVSLQPGA
jgi:hypothetical protein